MTEPLRTGARIGILGGGQLGRMLSVAAARLGFTTHVFDPAPNPPAGHVADTVTTAGYDAIDALRAFARDVDVVTFEFENVPAEALDAIEAIVPIRPGRASLATSQDRLAEKRFLEGLGLGTAPFAPVDDLAGLEAALGRIGTPAILKTRRLGYDGKGQVWIRADEEAPAALEALAGAPAILEGVVRFDREVSVIAARAQDGAVVAFDPGENLHEGGILRTTVVPSAMPADLAADAVLIAGRILNALEHVGVMGVELFQAGRALFVNEIAPRVHNSGHWTQNGCVIDQFEQHIRAIAGWPLGDGRRFADVTMENLIGDDVRRIPEIARDPRAAIHLYGKAEVRPGRKMGHVNTVHARG
ncbi:MAG: 5-(carboxyamino)imidazole ribonucleotide synthase [Alphaproteobacteria bacterium]|nr:MAG: 5-(carboxyamino)imidazole ribonucleotide synthase [Alphaproteobacteria bacterium]